LITFAIVGSLRPIGGIVGRGGCDYLGGTLASDTMTRIQLCGPLVVRHGDRRLEDALPGRQGRLLFAYLVVNRRRPVSRDELADALWPGEPPSAPGLALNPLLSKLRRVLGTGAIEGRNGVRLELENAWVDVEAAEIAVHEAESAAAQRDWYLVYPRSRVALYIAERGFLPGTDAPWVDEQRRRVDDIRLRAIEAAAECSLEIGGAELPIAEQHARRLVELSPYHERGHALLMRALETRGNAAEAMLAYDRLRCLLRDDLGIAPGPEIQSLHERLLRGEAPAVTS
jgi:SARP family transcriptional regulator, regulator of embCAB operon